RAEALLLLAGKFILRVALEARISEFADLGMLGEKLRRRAAVFLVLLNAQRKGLDATQHQEALKGRHHRAHGLLDQTEAFLVLRLGADQCAAKAVRVAVQVLRRR